MRVSLAIYSDPSFRERLKCYRITNSTALVVTCSSFAICFIVLSGWVVVVGVLVPNLSSRTSSGSTFFFSFIILNECFWRHLSLKLFNQAYPVPMPGYYDGVFNKRTHSFSKYLKSLWFSKPEFLESLDLRGAFDRSKSDWKHKLELNRSLRFISSVDLLHID